MRKAVFRVAGNEFIGIGHVMRMLSLADELRAHGWNTIFCGSYPHPLHVRIRASGHRVIGPDSSKFIPPLLNPSSEITGDWAILDGYQFGVDAHLLTLEAGWRLMVMDDYCHLPAYAADLVVNQNIGSETYTYRLNRAGRTLLGTRYALLRTEFGPWQSWKRFHPTKARNILVTLGGGDSSDAIFEVIQALNRVVGYLHVCVVAGVANSRIGEIEQVASGAPLHRIHVLRHTNQMPRLMAWADMAVTAGGSTLWECAFMGLPTAVLCLADNQLAGARGMGAAGAAIYLGRFGEITPELLAAEVLKLINDCSKRTSIGLAGRDLVDGRGAERVRLAMESIL